MYGPRWLPNNPQVIFSAADASLFNTGVQESPSLLLALVDLLLAPHPVQAISWIGDIWRVNSDGSALTRLTARKFQAPIAAPSPDGSHIAVVSGEGLFIMNADGTGLEKISEDGSNGNITWSH
jgi:Tol biopolymer transport system component